MCRLLAMSIKFETLREIGSHVTNSFETHLTLQSSLISHQITPKSTVSVDSFKFFLASATAFTSISVSMLLKLSPAMSFCAVRLLKLLVLMSAMVRSLMLGNVCTSDDVELGSSSLFVMLATVVTEGSTPPLSLALSGTSYMTSCDSRL